MSAQEPFHVWTSVDFLDLGARAGIDKALQKLAKSNDIRRIDRGLYDVPKVNRLTGKVTTPDYPAIIEAVARRDQIRILVDGRTAANQLGLADAVPAHLVVHTDARIRPIKLGKLTITFKLTAPSRLYWAGRPAMRVVQALHWVRDLLPTDQNRILKRLQSIISDFQILDRYHVKETLHRTAQAILGATSQAAKSWATVRCTELDDGKLRAIVGALRPPMNSYHEATKCAMYIFRNRRRMRYPQFHAQGLCTSTGVREAGCKVVIGTRLKRTGKHWTTSGADAIIALCCSKLSGRFEDFWESRSDRFAPAA